jgi:hypothetical protein
MSTGQSTKEPRSGRSPTTIIKLGRVHSPWTKASRHCTSGNAGSCDAQPGNVWLNPAVVGDPAQGAACGFPEWMQDFLTIALGRAYEMGFDGALGMFQYSGQRLIGAMSDPGYSARLLGFYNLPDVKWPSQEWFRTWTEMATGFVNNGKGIYPQYWANTGGETYWDVSHGAVGESALLPGGWLRIKNTTLI